MGFVGCVAALSLHSPGALPPAPATSPRAEAVGDGLVPAVRSPGQGRAVPLGVQPLSVPGGIFCPSCLLTPEALPRDCARVQTHPVPRAAAPLSRPVQSSARSRAASADDGLLLSSGVPLRGAPGASGSGPWPLRVTRHSQFREFDFPIEAPGGPWSLSTSSLHGPARRADASHPHPSLALRPSASCKLWSSPFSFPVLTIPVSSTEQPQVNPEGQSRKRRLPRASAPSPLLRTFLGLGAGRGSAGPPWICPTITALCLRGPVRSYCSRTGRTAASC